MRGSVCDQTESSGDNPGSQGQYLRPIPVTPKTSTGYVTVAFNNILDPARRRSSVLDSLRESVIYRDQHECACSGLTVTYGIYPSLDRGECNIGRSLELIRDGFMRVCHATMSVVETVVTG